MKKWTSLAAIVFVLILSFQASSRLMGRTADLFLCVGKGTAGTQYLGHATVVGETWYSLTFRGWTPRGGELFGGTSKLTHQMALVVWRPSFTSQPGALFWFVGQRLGGRMILYDFVSGTWFLGHWVWR